MWYHKYINNFIKINKYVKYHLNDLSALQDIEEIKYAIFFF